MTALENVVGFHRWESVKELQGYLGELPFELMYDLYRWKFLTKKSGLARSIRRLMDFSNLQYSHTSKLSKLYGDDIFTISGMSAGIETFFEFN